MANILRSQFELLKHEWTLNNNHLSTTVTFWGPKGGRCTQTWVYWKSCLQKVVTLTSGVNFTSNLWADIEMIKRHRWLDCLFALLESAPVKAASKHVVEIDIRTTRTNIGLQLQDELVASCLRHRRWTPWSLLPSEMGRLNPLFSFRSITLNSTYDLYHMILIYINIYLIILYYCYKILSDITKNFNTYFVFRLRLENYK